MTADTETRARRIRLLLFDVDGVLTDGRLLLHADGSESKQFNIHDGTGLVLAERAGLRTGFLSARQSAATTERAVQLRVPIVRQGAADKLEALVDILRTENLSESEVAYMGDDLVDLPVLARVGLPAAPADAVPEVLARVAWVSQRGGGAGAARELVELVLRAQGRWDAVVSQWLEVAGRP